jgi:hypothetical protein
MKNPIKQTSLKEDAGKVLVDIDERSEIAAMLAWT